MGDDSVKQAPCHRQAIEFIAINSGDGGVRSVRAVRPQGRFMNRPYGVFTFTLKYRLKPEANLCAELSVL